MDILPAHIILYCVYVLFRILEVDSKNSLEAGNFSRSG
jgi:hypothetical protein